MLPVFTTQSESADAPLGKVELDLEGAPFLEPEPDETAEAAAEQAGRGVQATKGDGELPGKRRKRPLVILGVILLGVLLAAALLAYLLIFRAETEPDIPPDVQVIVVPSSPPAPALAPVDRFQISWDPFWVEVADPEGEIRFVYCKIMLVTDNQRIALQLDQKRTTIRDAVYYYLRNKPYSFLADLKQLDTLKAEMLNIINYYILPETVIPPDLQPGEGPPPGSPRERLKDLLIEEYLVK